MIKKSLTLLLILLLTGISSSAASRTADDIVKSTTDKLRSSKAVRADYEMIWDGTPAAGNVTIQGDRFHLKSSAMTVWYDGRTQWTYSPSSNEVSITEPTPDELAQINPLVILNSLRTSFKSRLVKAPKGEYKVELTPKNTRNSQIVKAVISVNASTYYPSSVALTFDNGSSMTIKIKSIKPLANQSTSTFVFNNKQFPKAEIVDLR